MRPLFYFFYLMLIAFLLPLEGVSIGIQVDGFQYRTHRFWNKHGKLRPAHNHLNFTGADVWLSAQVLCNLQLDLWTAWQNGDESLNGTVRGFADPELSATSQLTQMWGGDLFAQGVLIVPAGREREMIRYGCWGGEFDLLYRYSLPYCSLYSRLGFRGYSGKASDLVRSTIGADFWPDSPLSLCTSLQLDYGLFNGKRDKHPNALLYNTNFRLLYIDGILRYNFWKGCSLHGGGFYHLWGENIGNSGGFFGGISCVF